ncbi:c-type cytochrome [Azospirillum formosense]|uniref:C-type cytochrome n=1 Tax=Azospirillum formosense TaxID=861533 RepID=A0ABX2KYX1_9PROT|nr:c-type cytochrome [Azospirillum formosense]MBY3755887.1 c-type cytochrome [Azospirillum formosense]NUB19051.1 c-type cytochrome [Azospirillum formosense]
MKTGLCAGVLMACFAVADVTQAADAEAGRSIVDRWCAACHITADGNADSRVVRGTDAVPTLSSIARNPNRSPNWLRQWLSSPHPPMPDLNLSRSEIDDVIAYLQEMAR